MRSLLLSLLLSLLVAGCGGVEYSRDSRSDAALDGGADAALDVAPQVDFTFFEGILVVGRE